MSSSVEVEHIGHLDVDNSEEALVAFLEFALVKDLDGNDRRVLDLAAQVQASFRFVGDRVGRRGGGRLDDETCVERKMAEKSAKEAGRKSAHRHRDILPPPSSYITRVQATRRLLREVKHVHVESLVEVGVQRLLDDRGRVGRLPIDGDDGEGVGQAKIG